MDKANDSTFIIKKNVKQKELKAEQRRKFRLLFSETEENYCTVKDSDDEEKFAAVSRFFGFFGDAYAKKIST
jgi:hypothetical protein